MSIEPAKDTTPSTPSNLAGSPMSQVVETIWHAQVRGWESGSIDPAEGYFNQYPGLLDEEQFAIDVVFNEFALRSKLTNAAPDPHDFYQRFPQLMPSLRKQLDLFLALDEQLEDHELDFEETVKLADATTVDEENPGQPNSSLAAVSADLPPRYQIRHELGAGASSRVYEAWDDDLKQAVAIKKPHADSQNSPRVRKRLIQEARAVSRLHHPRIVSVREISSELNRLYLVSPLIKGQSLAERILESKPTIAEAVEWIAQLAEALHYAHENGVVHRDVKPANIIIDESDSPVLTDFGLATNRDFRQSITMTGDLVGTPAYMSPEQVLGPAETGPKADVYSLGVTFFQLLTGQLPFTGSFSKVIHQVLEDPAPSMRRLNQGIPRDLEAIVQKCLEKEPQQRYLTARDLADDLQRFRNGEPVHAAAINLPQKLLKLVRRYPIATIGASLAACFIAFSIGILWQLNRVVDQRDRAVAAESLNQNLLVISSTDAGDLARQQGKFSEAIKHYRQSLNLAGGDHSVVKFKLVECLVADGDAPATKQALCEIKQQLEASLEPNSPDRDPTQAKINYWNWELSAIGDDNQDLLEFEERDFQWLTQAQVEFVLGMQAKDSLTAVKHFANSVEADPYHHGANRMSMIMALSLAKHDEVIRRASTAHLLFPENEDMALLEALAWAGKNDIQKAEAIVAALPLPQEESKKWTEFCQFVSFVSRPMGTSVNLPTNLQTITMLTKSFLSEYLPLLEQRRWRFPRAIGKKFVQLPRVFKSNSGTQVALGIASDLASIHPEGTLVTVVAEMELANQDDAGTVKALSRSLDWHKKAVQCNSFFDGHQENAWLGVYANAVALALVHGHEIETNTIVYVEACREMDPNSPRLNSHHRTAAISLIHANEWQLAGKYAKAWSQRARSHSDHMDALWHQAIVHKRLESWSDVIRCCQQANEFANKNNADVAQHDWNGLTKFAKQKFGEMDAKPTIVSE